MKVRSKALYLYLLQANVLNGSEEDVLRSKQAYRKEYRRKWKQQSRPRKEIRFSLTIREFELLRASARFLDLRPTTYVKSLALSAIEQPAIYDSRLLEVLQLVSLAAMALSNGANAGNARDLIERAESDLLKYLNVHYKKLENEDQVK